MVSADKSDETEESELSAPIPLTILSGFLGAGKTTVLRHLLENKQGLRVGVVVNDVAAVNVDAKLVQRDGREAEDGLLGEEWAEDLVELSNGCACCSAGDDFFGALSQLVSLSFMREIKYDHIVFEASGVAEPKLIRAMLQEATTAGWPLMKCVQLESMCTVVDASNFLELFETADRVTDREDLGYIPPEEDSGWLSALTQGVVEPERGATVAQLLAEQIEIADVLVLNKVDRVDDARESELKQTLGVINGFADVITVEYGKVPFEQLLTTSRQAGVALSNEVMDHQSAVDFAKWLRSQPSSESDAPDAAADHNAHEHSHGSSHEHSHEKSHEHSHENSHTEQAQAHEHSHESSHEHSHENSHTEQAQAHEHSHESSHEHSHENSHTEQAQAHEHSHESSHEHSHHEHSHEHSHAHSHEHSHGSSCDDPTCTDPSHDHSHDERQQTTAAKRFGIGTFVYSRRRPFAPARLAALVKKLRFIPDADACKPLLDNGVEPSDAEESPGALSRKSEDQGVRFDSVLRSKGFFWLAGEDGVAYYWSQAGAHVEFSEMGRWWAAVPRESWPEAHTASIEADFVGEGGDRRQELVFIGAGMSESEISDALDACLLTDVELAEAKVKAAEAAVGS